MAKRKKTTTLISSSASASTQTAAGKVKTKRSGSGSKVKTTKKRIESLKPKKPPTAFFYFLEDFRKEYQEQNPDVKSMRDIGKACGVKWKTMTYEEKVHYYDIATEKRAEFDTAMADFIRKRKVGNSTS